MEAKTIVVPKVELVGAAKQKEYHWYSRDSCDDLEPALGSFLPTLRYLVIIIAETTPLNSWVLDPKHLRTAINPFPGTNRDELFSSITKSRSFAVIRGLIISTISALVGHHKYTCDTTNDKVCCGLT